MTAIKFKRSSVPSKIPLTTDLADGEIALNTNDGKLFFKKTVSGTSTIVPISPLKVSLISGGSSSNETSNIDTLRFDQDSGFTLQDLGNGATKIGLNQTSISTFKYWVTPGQDILTPVGQDTINIVAGSGVVIETNTSTKSVTISSSISAGVNLIKTFNILNDFQAPLLGTAVFVPTYTDFIRSIVMVNGVPLGRDLTVGLFKNGQLLDYFTMTVGNFKAVFSGFLYRITRDDYLTVDVVAGSGLNFNMSLLNTYVS
jgi:hypothetical protein